MDETYTVSLWTARDGQGEAFVDAFRAYAAAASDVGGAHEGMILQDADDPARFAVVRRWDGSESVDRWTAQEEQSLGDAVAATATNGAAYVMRRVAEL